MILGVGLDLADIERIGRAIEKPHFLERIFSEEERTNIAQKGAQTAAGYWAAKEAIAKALGTGFADGIMPDQIEVTHDAAGAPGVLLHGRALERMQKVGGARVMLSLSHEENTAIAFAVITKES